MIQESRNTRIRYALGFASVVVVFALTVWVRQSGGSASAPMPTVDLFVGLNLTDPDCSYQAVRHAAETGGNPRTREVAIIWLDRQSRRHLSLNSEQEVWLLDKLADNGHATWEPEYRFLFFNSAFNVLHLGRHQEDLTRQLQKLSFEAPEKTMRLYALQHIAVQRSFGHLTGQLAEEVRASLFSLASQPSSAVAGSALSALIDWDGIETTPDPQLITLALNIAKDQSCEVDVRVAALHSAREQSLPLARQLAPDIDQPVPLRKAAIGSIGMHGEASDCVNLETFRSENFRLAQAAEPALRAIEKRISHPHTAEPIPF